MRSDSADQLVQQVECPLPGALRVGLPEIQRLQRRAEDVLLDDGVLRALVLGFDADGAFGENRSGGGVIEERVRGRFCGQGLLSLDGARVTADLRAPLTGVAPGQALVMYRGDEVIGSATITAAERAPAEL